MSNNSSREQVLFEEAVKRASDAERSAYLDEACRGHPEMRARLELLVEGHFQPGGFLPEPTEPRPAAADEAIGSIIGRYKLLEKIGEGGFGAVYLAEQKEPVKRRVALKIIKLGMDTNQVVARFEAERQAMALMDHPNIAKVHDGGTTDMGRPYFVMELVRGASITEYCNENGLSPRERLELFMRVCQAVQHAHQKGIIHRDLKPSNILVTVNDGVAVPKVIDFGVAKATQQELTEKIIFTQFHHFIGTPAYMSPEQAVMTSGDIDTRSDIYALGVLLYELLTGKTPFDSKELLASGLDEMRRIIRETEPFKPSTRLARERMAAKAAIPNAQAEIDSDLDWIVMKCLEKDRNRRYQTANELAMDLARHLNDEPVSACPPSMAYRLRKMVHRHKLAFAATVTVVLALLGGIGATSWQAVRAARAEQWAEQRRQAAMRILGQAFDRVSPALSDIIGGAQPREILARAAAGAIRDLQQGAEPDAESRAVLGQLYYQLAMVHGWYIGNTTGDYDAALKAITNSIALLESSAAAVPRDDTLNKLIFAEQGAALIDFGLLKPGAAIEHFQKSRQWAIRLGQQTTNASLRSFSENMQEAATGNIADMHVRIGRVTEALTNYYLPELARMKGRGVSDQATNVWDLWGVTMTYELMGLAYGRLEQYREALPHLREALRLHELINQRRPHSAQFSSALAMVRAEVGEVLLCLHEPEEGFQFLLHASELAEDLAKRDPANAGFAQLKIEVARRSAAGCIAWADAPTVSSADRRSRLDRAETHLKLAQSLLAGLKSESLRRFLAADLNPVIAKAAKAAKADNP